MCTNDRGPYSIEGVRSSLSAILRLLQCCNREPGTCCVMKISCDWQVEILRPGTTRPFPEVCHHADRYIVGVADQPFVIRVTAPPSRPSDASYIRAHLRVDGRGVGYSKIVEPHCVTATFDANTIDVKHIVTQFRFGRAQTQSDLSQSSITQDPSVGTLHISIQRSHRLPGLELHHHASAQAAQAIQPTEGACCA